MSLEMQALDEEIHEDKKSDDILVAYLDGTRCILSIYSSSKTPFVEHPDS
jgi:hypothetical protein